MPSPTRAPRPACPSSGGPPRLRRAGLRVPRRRGRPGRLPRPAPRGPAGRGVCAADGVLPALCGAVGCGDGGAGHRPGRGPRRALARPGAHGRRSALALDRERLRRGPGSARPAARRRSPSPRGSPRPSSHDATTGGTGTGTGSGTVLVDVRTDEERATGVIPGSLTPGDLTDPDPGDELVVVCASGKRATPGRGRPSRTDRPGLRPSSSSTAGSPRGARRASRPRSDRTCG